jgi:hypothetical protein
VSLTPHAQKSFRTTAKSKNHVNKSDGMQKNRQIIQTALAAFKVNIYKKKNIYVPELSYPTTKKIYK